MKTFITLITFILIVAIGMASFMMFQQSDYTMSALLTIAGFFALNGWVYYLAPKPQTSLQ